MEVGGVTPPRSSCKSEDAERSEQVRCWDFGRHSNSPSDTEDYVCEWGGIGGEDRDLHHLSCSLILFLSIMAWMSIPFSASSNLPLL